jgi:hypothetical protein
VHQGFPLVTLPGGNVFFTNEDLSTPDGVITCKQISPGRSLYDAVKAAKYLARIAAELFG